MADDSNAGTDISYNVAVAKRMTVPDEIRLTGPPRQTKSTVPSSTMESDGQLEKTTHPDAYVVGDLESATSNGNKRRVGPGNISSELTRTLPEETSAEMMARVEAVEEEVRQIKERLDDFEASVPYLGTRKSVLNTLVFLTWLILPVGILYLLTPRRR